jgi:hypothetical protein
MIAIDQTTISATSAKRMMLSVVNLSVVTVVASSFLPATSIDI